MNADPAAPMVRLHTGFGAITIELNPAKAPKTVENFLRYVKSGHYDKTLFHRVINGFMIQGGGFESGMRQKPTEAPIENEAANGLRNEKYTIAMARTADPHSATAQFFINVADNDFLDHTSPTAQGWGYCVFGKVVDGTDVVDRIKAVRTIRYGMHQDVPEQEVLIERAEIVDR
jgi:peptidyl-prolyl cis-trans isomerase B (cyclophilin B)